MPQPQRKTEHSALATSVNPATGKPIEHFAHHTAAEIEQRLADAATGFATWRDTPIEQRAKILRNMAAILRKNQHRYALAMTSEMGKLFSEAKAEVEKCAHQCEWFAEHGPAMLADEPVKIDNDDVCIAYRPLGTVLGIMPWNFPFWQAMRAAVPILLGGNGFLLKHASNVTRCALDLEDAWREARLPNGVFTTLITGSKAIESIIRDKRIAAVTLTGSIQAGASVAATAGSVAKKTVLELGGSDPFVVLADADIDRAVEAGIKARFTNCGQVCIAAKRFILEAPIAKTFTEKFVAAAQALTPGDPLETNTTLAPLARDDLRQTLHAQVQKTIAQGAKLLCGGQMRDGAGFFYAPTVLGDVHPGIVAFEEETFGPVAALTTARDAEEALALANRSDYGLSGNLWCADASKAKAFAARMETGAVFINGFSLSDPRVPIGGIKSSGYGRELAHFGIREFVNAQTVWRKK